MKMIKPLLALMSLGLTLGIIVAGGTFYWAAQEFKKPGPLQSPALITIQRGASTARIAQTLLNHGAINTNGTYIFQYAARMLGTAPHLKAGEYKLAPYMSIEEITDLLQSGKVYQRAITIPEGLTSYEIVNLLSQTEDLKGEQITTIPDEGTLLPETYNYSAAETRTDILARLQEEMKNTIFELCKSNTERDALTDHSPDKNATNPQEKGLPFSSCQEALTLASIVEKETGKPEERRRVAGVFINRLRRGMPLQTDPTVIYAITQGKHQNNGKGPLGRRLLKKDLKFDSPYNTYLYPGLPPGPIANPGRAAIAATLNPEEHDYIYFVADGTGGHAFAKTLKEHNRNVAKWRKFRKSQKK